jgi:hypothetical protein
MNKFLIEVPHGGDEASCIRSIEAFLRPRTHLVSSVEWGCKDGANVAWLIVKTEKEEDAMQIIPAVYRQQAKITKLRKFSLDGIEELDVRVDPRPG